MLSSRCCSEQQVSSLSSESRESPGVAFTTALPGFFMTNHVPRILDMTGRKSAEDKAVDMEWQRERKLFQSDKLRYGFGTVKGKKAWKRRIDQTRSF